MTNDVPGPDPVARVGLFLDVTRPHWACRACIARTLELSIGEIKVALLQLARSRGPDTIETGCDTCVGCGAATAVLRLPPPRALKRVA